MLDYLNNDEDRASLVSMLQIGDMLLAMNGCPDVETSIIAKDDIEDVLGVDPDTTSDIVVLGAKPDGSETIAVANVDSLGHTFFSMLHSIGVCVTLRKEGVESVKKAEASQAVDLIIKSAQFAIDELLMHDVVPMDKSMKMVCLEVMSQNIIRCTGDKLDTIQPWTDFFEKNKEVFDAGDDEYKRLYEAVVLG